MSAPVRSAWGDRLSARVAERRRDRLRYSAEPGTGEWQSRLGYTPQAGPQTRFHASNIKNRGYGGAAGGGKSYAGMMEMVRLAIENPGSTGAIFRRTYGELEESIIKELLSDTPEYLYSYRGNREARFKNGSVIWFRHCKHEQSIYRYQSAQIDHLFVDEATHFTWHMIQYLCSRTRKTSRGGEQGVRRIFASNPGNIGHGWYRSLFKDRDPDFYAEWKLDPAEWEFTPALLADNPILEERDPGYRRDLENLPDDERKALLDGVWDLFAGQFFNFMPTRSAEPWHVQRASDFMIAEHWPRYLAMDYGGTAPNAIFDLAYDREMDRVIYVGEDVAAGCTVPQNAERAMARWDIGRYRRFADPSIFARNQARDRSSIADQWAQAGCSWLAAYNDRTAGAALMRQYMHRVCPDGLPAFIVLDTCPTLIRELPLQIYDPADPEDIKQAASIPDHCYDAARYGICAAVGLTGNAKPQAGGDLQAVRQASPLGRVF